MTYFDPEPSQKKYLISFGLGTLIFVLTWFYQNSSYSVFKEDSFYTLMTFVKYRWLEINPTVNTKALFINTGKDLSIIVNKVDSNNLAISDRYKIYQLLSKINSARIKPKFVVLDLKFDNPYKFTYNADLQNKINNSPVKNLLPNILIDSYIKRELTKNKNIVLSVQLNHGEIDTPVYKGNFNYGVSDYRFFGENLSKFRLNYYDDNHAKSLPVVLYTKINGSDFSGNNYFSFYDNHICLNYLWPQYYYDFVGIRLNTLNHEYYNIGKFLTDYKKINYNFKDKIVFIGDFDNDKHDTPIGNMPGTVILFDIYLSLLNGCQFVSIWWCLFVILSFSFLSYKAVYGKWPIIKKKEAGENSKRGLKNLENINKSKESFRNLKEIFKLKKTNLKVSKLEKEKKLNNNSKHLSDNIKTFFLHLKNLVPTIFLPFRKVKNNFLSNFFKWFSELVVLIITPFRKLLNAFTISKFYKRHKKKLWPTIKKIIFVSEFPARLILISLISNLIFNINIAIVPAFGFTFLEYLCVDDVIEKKLS